jgi:hypothetical protein
MVESAHRPGDDISTFGADDVGDRSFSSFFFNQKCNAQSALLDRHEFVPH